MKQKSFVMNLLLIGVLALSACSKADSPKGNYSGNNGGDGDGGGSNTPSLGDIIKDICNKNANAQLCQDIQGETEASLQDAKPITLLDDQELYGAKDPVAWTAGGTITIKDSVYFLLGVDDGSIFSDGEAAITKYYVQADGSKAATSDDNFNIIMHNGWSGVRHLTGGDAGKTLMRLTFVPQDNKYIILPPIKVTAN